MLGPCMGCSACMKHSGPLTCSQREVKDTVTLLLFYLLVIWDCISHRYFPGSGLGTTGPFRATGISLQPLLAGGGPRTVQCGQNVRTSRLWCIQWPHALAVGKHEFRWANQRNKNKHIRIISHKHKVLFTVKEGKVMLRELTIWWCHQSQWWWVFNSKSKELIFLFCLFALLEFLLNPYTYTRHIITLFLTLIFKHKIFRYFRVKTSH